MEIKFINFLNVFLFVNKISQLKFSFKVYGASVPFIIYLNITDKVKPKFLLQVQYFKKSLKYMENFFYEVCF